MLMPYVPVSSRMGRKGGCSWHVQLRLTDLLLQSYAGGVVDGEMYGNFDKCNQRLACLMCTSMLT